ncbi:MAG: hypothetical protein ACOCNC_01680 [Acetivibrio ethanolgignens]
MKQKLKFYGRKLDNRGSITVLTMVAVFFLGILGSSILSMTHINMQMKAVNTKTQKNFYDTDSILDEIKAGLANTSSEAVAEAYTKVLENYGTISKTSVLQSAFEEYYMDGLLQKLTGETPANGGKLPETGKEYRYKKELLESYLAQDSMLEEKKNSIRWEQDKAMIQVFSEQKYLLLKNIEILKQEGDYETVLKTDIRMEVPFVSFSKESLYPEYTRYAILADDQIVVDGSQNISVEGNLYAGTVNRKKTGENGKAGIVVQNSGNLTVTGEQVITRGDVLVSNSSKADFKGNEGQDASLWAQNLLVEADSRTSSSQLSITGKTYIEDDLEMNGNGGKVTLSGSYYGYHNKKDYSTGETAATDSAYSSAILVNGKNNTLDMTGLKELVLAGRSFISRRAGEGNQDILTGESLGVKSGQMAYFVPKAFVSEGNSGTGDSYTFEDSTSYRFDLKGYESYLGFEVKEYLDTARPLTRYYLQESSSRVCYYYLNFKNQEAAAHFHELYYAAQKNTQDAGARRYLSEQGIRLGDGKQILLVSGSLLYQEGASNGQMNIKGGNTGGKEDFFDAYATTYGRAYKSRQLGLISNLPESYGGSVRLSEEEKAGNSLFDRLVDRNKLKAELGNEESKAVTIDLAGGKKAKVWLANGNFTFDAGKAVDENCRIILATGDVTLEHNFEGMVLAGGDVKMSGTGLAFKAASQMVQDTFQADTTNQFRSYFKVKNEDDNNPLKNTIDYGSYITYEGWKKNEE